MGMTDAAVRAGTPEIPDKLYFKIGEVADLLGVEPYVLRYWETEFPALAPNKSGGGQRLYSQREIDIILRINRIARIVCTIEDVRTGAIETMSHPGSHKEPVEIPRLLQAALVLHNGAVVINLLDGIDEHVAPALIENRFAAV